MLKDKRVFLIEKGFSRGHWKVINECKKYVWLEGKTKCSRIEKEKVKPMKEIYLR